jgi:hypothetical protein
VARDDDSGGVDFVVADADVRGDLVVRGEVATAQEVERTSPMGITTSGALNLSEQLDRTAL